MELKQQLKLSQQLVMTPQLQQAIKLLQLSRLELTDLISQEINENPVLDESADSDASPNDSPDSEAAPAETEPELKDTPDIPVQTTPETPAEKPQDEPKNEFDWQEYLEKSVRPTSGSMFGGGGDDREPFEPIITRKTSFSDHLVWQLHLQDLTEKEIEIGENVIGNLDRDGYLKATYEEIAFATGASLELIEKVCKKIQTFDPLGVGARDLSECLYAQATILHADNAILKRILLHHMKDLEKKKFQAISKGLNISLKEVIQACEIISNMEPRPGRSFNDNETQYITPDIYVYKLDDEYIVSLNEDGQPKLRINSYYRNILANRNLDSEKAREYIQEKLRSAVWLIKSIYHRQSTIVNVMKSIIKFQFNFFEYGSDHLKPLVLRDIAEDVQMHESNISRVTTNKYVHTPHGIFELKYFFNSGLTSDNGEAIASESVKIKIKDMIQKEDPYKTLSDQEIANLLKEQGINIARRTVTKYREMLGILSSTKRRKHI